MLDEFHIPAGTTAYIGAPAQPFPPELTERIRTLVVAAGVGEAHLPQCYIAGVVDPSAQVLVIVLARTTDGAELAASLSADLRGVLQAGRQLLVWPLRDDHELLPSIRNASCQIVGIPERRLPWWKFWA